MMSALIRVRDANGKFVEARALLDTCATAHFVTDSFAKRLKLHMRLCSIPIGAINQMQTMSKNSVEMSFRSTNNDFQKTLTFLTVPKIADFVPEEAFPRDLMNSGATISLLSIGQINLSRNNCDLYLQKTQLGWVVVGGAGDEERSVISIV